jgi:hypothetical protein
MEALEPPRRRGGLVLSHFHRAPPTPTPPPRPLDKGAGFDPRPQYGKGIEASYVLATATASVEVWQVQSNHLVCCLTYGSRRFPSTWSNRSPGYVRRAASSTAYSSINRRPEPSLASGRDSYGQVCRPHTNCNSNIVGEDRPGKPRTKGILSSDDTSRGEADAV